ncbi:MAG: transporter [Verrucomicrobia bacterium]|nr:transporter [Verrucomicrobiota bacterium]
MTEPFDFAGRLAFGVEGTIYADTIGLLYKTPLRILGGSYAVTVALPVVWVEVNAQSEFSSPRGRLLLGRNVKDTASGLGDITIYPFMLGWNQLNGDLKYDLRLAVYAPTGGYSVGQLANTGKNYWTFEPGLPVSWLSSKIGTEINFFSGFDINTQNDATHYQSGAVFHLDATIAQHLPLFGGFIGVGANVFYYQQISADSGSGAKLGSFEGNTAGVGPVVSYARNIGKVDVVGEVKWLPEFSVDKRLKGDYLWVKLGLVF